MKLFSGSPIVFSVCLCPREEHAVLCVGCHLLLLNGEVILGAWVSHPCSYGHYRIILMYLYYSWWINQVYRAILKCSNLPMMHLQIFAPKNPISSTLTIDDKKMYCTLIAAMLAYLSYCVEGSY